MKDYYTILGVDPSASQYEIKKAFRQLAIRYHPDKNPSPEVRHLFLDINEAYDVLGDTEKRALYDTRRANPFVEIASDPTPHHPDPAYRRRRPPQPPRRRGPPASYILMRDNLKYVIWVSRVGLLVSSLFFIDYFLPYLKKEETITGISAVTIQGNISYHVISTESGADIKLYNYTAANFQGEQMIRVLVTPIYNSIMTVSNISGTYQERIAYMYRHLIFYPIALFLNSLLAVIFRKKVEFCFNLNIAATILLIITLILI